MFARKLLVDYQKTACNKQMSPGCVFPCEVLDRQTNKNKFGFLGNNYLHQYLNFVLKVIYCFVTLLSSCNLIGQPCLIGPGCSSHTVSE